MINSIPCLRQNPEKHTLAGSTSPLSPYKGVPSRALKPNDLFLDGFEIDLVTVFDAILTSRQTCKKLQCLYDNLKSNNFRKTAVLKKISIVN